jgi:hypothetical protein
MKLISLEKSQTTKLFWMITSMLLAVAVLTAEQSDPAVMAAGGLLALAAVMPFYLWLLGWSHGLPIWPVFALVTGVTYALPMIQDSAALVGYNSGEIITGGMTTIGFLLLGTMIWVSLTGRTQRPPRAVLMIERANSVRYLLLFVGAGLLFGVNQFTGWIQFPGNSMAVVRGITGSLNTMGLFVLAFYLGRGLLDKQSTILFLAGAVATMLMNMTSLMLAQAVVPAAMVVFGYMLGSNKVPWRALLMIFVVMGLLHPGKYEMRTRYWDPESGVQRLTLLTLPQFYADWLGYGLEEVGSVAGIVTGPKKEDAASSIFERSGNLHMLLLVQKKTPTEVPYFDGATYAPIPRLLIPRFIDDQKGISHAGNVMLTVNYGLQTIEQTASTSIGWGLLPEAYANFGYLGIAGLAIVLAIFYGLITNITVGVPMTSLRFVLGLLIMAAATRADTMGIFVTTQFQGVVGVSLAAMVLMRRQGNPFAADAANGGLQDSGTTGRRWMNGPRDQETKRQPSLRDGLPSNQLTKDEETKRHTAGGIRHTADGMRGDSGMPAPGVLSELIEGALPEGGGGQGAGDGGQGTGDRRQEAGGGGKQLTADGGTVRTFPIKLPKRVAAWMPRRVRAAVVAARSAAEGGNLKPETGVEEGEEGLKDRESKRPRDERARPRQVAVPYQNYRRYRG